MDIFEAIEIEMQKCIESPFYFATTYLRISTPTFPEPLPFTTVMTQEHFNEEFYRLQRKDDKEKFRRGDLVEILAPANSIWKFYKGIVATYDSSPEKVSTKHIILGSYSNIHDNSDYSNPNDKPHYMLIDIVNGYRSAWYYEHQLKLIKHVGEKGILEVVKRRR
jgi:hypothetical protein